MTSLITWLNSQNMPFVKVPLKLGPRVLNWMTCPHNQLKAYAVYHHVAVLYCYKP